MKFTAFAIGLVGVAAGFLLGLLVAPDPPAAGGSPSLEARELKRIGADLASIKSMLQAVGQRQGRLGPMPTAAEARPLTEPSVEGLAASIEELETTIGELSAAVAALRTGQSTAAPRLQDTAIRPTNHKAVAALRASLPDQGTVTAPDLFGLAPAAVYARFGTPAEVVPGSNDAVRWMYTDPENPRKYITITFMDAYAAFAYR